jgi:hypothetical protein
MSALFALAPASGTGLIRGNNEDAPYSGRWLCAASDGLGENTARAWRPF